MGGLLSSPENSLTSPIYLFLARATDPLSLKALDWKLNVEWIWILCWSFKQNAPFEFSWDFVPISLIVIHDRKGHIFYYYSQYSCTIEDTTVLHWKKKWGKAKIASLFQMANTVTVKTCDLITLVKALSLWSLFMKFRLIISSILLTCGESMVLSSAWHSFLRVKMHFSEFWTLLYVITILKKACCLVYTLVFNLNI